MLLGFGASACFTIICAAYYLIDQENVSNLVDCLFLRLLWGKKSFNASKKWIEALQSATLIFGDSQAITGNAGYSQLPCGLASYHWQIAVDLAWFSPITHLTTLTCLRHHLKNGL